MWRLLLVLAFDDPSFGPEYVPPTAELSATFNTQEECERWRRYFFEDPIGSEFEAPGVAPEWYVLMASCSVESVHRAQQPAPSQDEDLLAALAQQVGPAT